MTLNSVEVKDWMKISDKFAALENSHDVADISKIWDSTGLSKFLPKGV
jgi:hypothetical protein